MHGLTRNRRGLARWAVVVSGLAEQAAVFLLQPAPAGSDFFF